MKTQVEKNNRGHLFVFEGPDGTGKTSLAKATAELLSKNSVPCEYLASPGQKVGTLGHHIYQLHHNRTLLDTWSLSPTSLQALHIAAHIDAVENQIKPLLDSGICIVLDRFWWSTLVYGRAGGANMQTLTALVNSEITHWGELKPDQIFLIKRSEPIEREFNDNWQRLTQFYDQLFIEKNSEACSMVIDNAGTFENSLQLIAQVIESYVSRPLLRGMDEQKKSQVHDLVITAKQSNLTIFSPLAPAVPTEVYDTYWHFAAERQAIFFRRFERKPPPWTADPILTQYKFTNAYRASDRVSQYLIQHIIYKDDYSVQELFFRIMLFKIFNKIRTWELLVKEIGEITYADYKYEYYDAVITAALSRKEAVFSAAYIMPSGINAFGEAKKHRNYLKLLERMMQENVPQRLADAKRMRDAFELLLGYPTLGDFLAYQLMTDINYSCITNFTEMEFVMPGPGAKSGIRKCFKNTGGLNAADLIRLVTERQEVEFENRGIVFKPLWGRPLQLIDCQNLFCEVDKYARVAHPTMQGVGKRTQIKQKFAVKDNSPIDYWYPPKWGLNDKIAIERRQINGVCGTERQ